MELINYEAININCHEFVSIFLLLLSGLQIAPFLHHITSSFVAWLALPYFPTLPHKWHDFHKKRLLNIKYGFGFYLQLLSGTFLIL
jgi:hypothetical protein